jgi:hypothetical protein
MSWFDKHRWSHRRAELSREALAVSVEEWAAREPSNDEWDEEDENVVSTGRSALIPPRLRLQSRPMPIVRMEAAKSLPLKQEVARETRMPDADAQLVAPGKRLGHSTKVRLQAVHPVQTREPVTERVPSVDAPELPAFTRGQQAIVRPVSPPPVATEPVVAPSSLLCGSGVIEEGQEDATIHNARISGQSVVNIMLAGNPGPVVVHYISLQPRAGFTLHMSAPVAATTPFTYAVWLF